MECCVIIKKQTSSSVSKRFLTHLKIQFYFGCKMRHMISIEIEIFELQLIEKVNDNLCV